MRLFTALETLDLDGDFTIDDLKRQYRMKALMYHPDKNPSIESSMKFVEIQESYEFLKRYRSEYNWYYELDDNDDIYTNNNNNNNNNDSLSNSSHNIPIPKYKSILFSFLRGILSLDTNQELFQTILERVINSCEEKSLLFLEKLDIDILKKIYNILKKYKDVLHFDDEFFEKIENIWKMRTYKNEHVILNPTIDDLFEEKVYRLKMGDFLYIVPLWHHRLIYDQSGVDIIVECNPILPENIEIDEKNNITISITMKITDIWTMEKIPIHIGSRIFTIQRSFLKLIPVQKVVLYEKGIPEINMDNVYDVTRHADVTVLIYLEL